MNNLINITTNEQGSQVVSARELHEFLESKERFSKWFERMLSYGFEVNIDFTSVQKSTVVNNGAKREIIDYALTISMAKEIAMLQKNEKGKQARKYFIDCEKQLQDNRFSLPQTFSEALQLAANLEEEKQRAIDQNRLLEAKIEEDKPKLEFADTLISSSTVLRKVSQVAKELSNHSDVKIGQKTLYDYLRGINWVYAHSTEPKQEAVNKGYLVLKEHQIKTQYGTTKITPQTLVTPKGMENLLRRLKKNKEQFQLF